MADRKSRRKAPPKVDEDAEPEGFAKLKENPVFILGMIILAIVGVVFLIWLLSRFLSGAGS